MAGALALKYARANKPEEAMRLWRTAVNQDWTHTQQLAEMAGAGLREPLRQFYLQLQARDPKSTAPAAALAILQTSKDKGN
jgi:hypothetical protein